MHSVTVTVLCGLYHSVHHIFPDIQKQLNAFSKYTLFEYIDIVFECSFSEAINGLDDEGGPCS